MSRSQRRSRGWTTAFFGLLLVLGASPLCFAQNFTQNVTIDTDDTPSVSLNQSNAIFPAQVWQLFGNEEGARFFDGTSGNVPLMLRRDGNFGRVGFGTSFPQTKLHAFNDDGPLALRLEDGSGFPRTWDVEGGGLGFSIKDVSGGFTPLTILPGAPTNSMFIDTLGNFGVGTAEPKKVIDTNLTGKVICVRSATSFGRLACQGTSGGLLDMVHLNAPANQKTFRLRSQNGLATFQIITDTASAVAFEPIKINMATGNVGFRTSPSGTNAITVFNGARCTAGGVWTNASSRDLKQDIEPLTSEQALATVRALQPVGYRYKNELDEHYVGFIAEDVPELVASKDRKALASMDLVGVLTKVVQDQDKQLDEQRELIAKQDQLNVQQQETLAALMRRLADLEQKMGDR